MHSKENEDKSIVSAFYKSIYFIVVCLITWILKYYFEINNIKINIFLFLFIILFFISVFFYIKWNKIQPIKSEDWNVKKVTYNFFLLLFIAFLFELSFKNYYLRKGGVFLTLFSIFLLILLFLYYKNSDLDDFFVKSKVEFKIDTKNFLIVFLFIIIAVIIAQIFAVKNFKSGGFIFFTIAFVLLFFLMREGDIKNIEYKEKNKAFNYTEYFKRIILFSISLLLFIIAYKFLEKDNIKSFLIYYFIFVFLFGLSLKNLISYKNEKYDNIEIFQIIVFFIFALFLRVYKLIDFPNGIGPDEMNSLTHIILRYKYMQEIPFISPLLSVPSFHFEIMKNILNIFGINLFSSRLIYAILGSFVIVFIYIISKELFNKKTAILSSFVYLFMYSAILFSRIAAVTWIFPVFYMTGMVCFLILSIKYNKIIYYILTGVLCGLSVYSYHPGKFAPVLLFFLIIFSIKKEKNIINYKGMLLTFLSFIITFFPFLFFIFQGKDNFAIAFSRVSNQSVFNYLNIKDINSVNVFIVNTFNYFFYILKNFVNLGLTSSHSFYFPTYEPLIDKVTSFFFLLGLGWCLFNIKKINSRFILLSFFITLLPQLFSISPPHEGVAITRLLIVFPFVAVLAGVGIGTVIEISKYFINKPKDIFFVLFIIFLLPLIFVENYNKFLKNINEPSANHPYYSNFNKLFKYLSNKENRDKVKVFSNYFTDSKGDYFNTMALYYNIDLKRKIYKLGITDLSEIYNSEKKDVILILDSSYAYIDDLYQYFFPDAKIKKFWNNYFWIYDLKSPIKFCYEWDTPDITMKNMPYVTICSPNEQLINFVIYDIPYKDIDELFCMKQYKYFNNKLIKDEKIKSYFFKKQDEENINKIIIRGYFYAPIYSQYIFFTEDNNMQTYIDGKKYDGKEYISEGVHKISFEKSINLSNQEQPIFWINPYSKKQEKIPEKYFYSKGHKNNIEVKYFDKNSKLIYKEKYAKIDITFSGGNYNIYNQVLKVAISVETIWQTKIYIKEDGEYSIKVETEYDTDLFVDNKNVFTKRFRPEDTKITDIKLTKGVHNIKIKSILGPYIYTPFRLVIKKVNDFRYKPVSYYDYR